VKPRYLFVLYSVVNGGLTLLIMDDAIVKTAVTTASSRAASRTTTSSHRRDRELAEFDGKADSAKLFSPFATLKALR